MPNETELEHHKRLVEGKLVDKTLADVDYAELSEYVYGQPYSSESTRKMLYGSLRTLQMLDDEAVASVSDSSLLAELERKTLELQKERQRFSDQRREYNKLVAKDGRLEHLEDRLVDAAEHLSETIGPMFAGRDPLLMTDSDTEAVLVLCDWHYGMVADNIWNSYNTEICKERIAQIVAKAKQRLMSHRCSKLHVVMLGDACHGIIHTSARVASSELACDQLMQVSELLAQTIDALSSCVEETVVYCTYGNHGRSVAKKEDSIHRDNMERIIPWWLQQRFQGRQDVLIQPERDDEFIFLDVAGHGICASHGDLDSVKSSTRLLPMVFQKVHGVDIECVLLADKHHRESFEELGVDSMICGALCGADDYANGKRLYSTPEQLMLIVTEADGVDAEYHLRCR